MQAKWIVFVLLLSPIALYANQENDLELFEFLAAYDEKDNIFIDAEIDDKDIKNENVSKKSLTNHKVSKSDSDE